MALHRIVNDVVSFPVIDYRWRLGAFGLLLAVAWLPGSLGASILGRLLVAALLPWLILPIVPRMSLSLRSVPLAVFVIWTACSAGWSPAPADALWGLLQLFIASGCFLLGLSADDDEPFYVGLGLGVPLAMAFGGFNPNFDLGGEAAAVATVGLAALDSPFVIIPLAAVLLAHSKGALLGLLVASLAGFRSWWFRGLLVCLVAGLAWYRGSGEGWASLYERWDIWRDTWAGLSVFGHGLGSFFTAYPWAASYQDVIMRPVEHAHNDFLEIVFEQGYVGGLLAICALVFLVWGRVRTVSGLVLIAVCAEAMVGFPLHNPITMVVAAFAVGGLCRRRMVYLSSAYVSPRGAPAYAPSLGSYWEPSAAANDASVS